jgi:dephospho-CoA kinase
VLALAVVGPIASGKTLVLRWLAELGAATCSADTVAAELTAPGQPAAEHIAAAFGEGFRRADGALDRVALARTIFRDRAARERLEAILHPLILERLRAWLSELRARPEAPAVAAVEVLRLPEALRARELFDVVWLCSAPAAMRRRRLIARDGLSEADARARIAVQETQGIEDCRPDLVLHAGGAEDELRAQVLAAWRGLLAGT